MAQELFKRSAETIPMQFDLSAYLPPGVVVESVVSLAVDQVTTPPIAFSNITVNQAPIFFSDTGTLAPIGTVVSFMVSGGLPTPVLAPYTVRLTYSASDNSMPEAIGYLCVADNPPIEWQRH